MKLYLRDYYEEEGLKNVQWKKIGQNPCYDLDKLPTEEMKKEMTAFIESQSHKVSFMTLFGQKKCYHKLCRFLLEYGRNVDSFKDRRQKCG